MIEPLATLMIQPLLLNKWQQALMLLPLCLAVSVVYKTTKCSTVREIPLASLLSWATIVVGMYLVGGVLLLVYEQWA